MIIVWNSPRDALNQAKDDKEKSYARKLLDWDADPSHPLRIFFSLENGLANNLLNRYHPSIKPKNEVVMLFDDDGPFWSRESMIDTGFELWKRNSDVQVGAGVDFELPSNSLTCECRNPQLPRSGVSLGISDFSARE